MEKRSRDRIDVGFAYGVRGEQNGFLVCEANSVA